MKYALITLGALAFLFTACEKKKEQTHCYICQHYDSVFSNIPGISEPTKVGDRDSICGQTDATIAFISESSKRIDTFYHKGDTFKMYYHTRPCTMDH